MNEIIEKIQRLYCNGERDLALKLLYASPLEVKLHFIKSGSFLYNIKENNSSFEIKKALINEGFEVEDFVEDSDWRVRFEVLKIHGSQFHHLFNFEDEHYQNQIQMLKNGYDIRDVFLSDPHTDIILYVLENYGCEFAEEHGYIEDFDSLENRIKLTLINNGKKISINQLFGSRELILQIIPKLNNANIEKIFNKSLDNEILKKCIEHADYIQGFYHHDKLNIFLNNSQNRVWSIDRGLYIKNILEKHKNCKDSICALIKNNYLNYIYDEEKDKTVMDLIFPIFDSNIADALLSVNQKILINDNLNYNDIIIKNIYSKITSIPLIDYLKQKTNCLKILSELNLRKDYLLKVKNNIDNTVIKFDLKNKLIKNI